MKKATEIALGDLTWRLAFLGRAIPRDISADI
jgi:hypothetical protein